MVLAVTAMEGRAEEAKEAAKSVKASHPLYDFKLPDPLPTTWVELDALIDRIPVVGYFPSQECWEDDDDEYWQLSRLYGRLTDAVYAAMPPPEQPAPAFPAWTAEDHAAFAKFASFASAAVANTMEDTSEPGKATRGGQRGRKGGRTKDPK